MGWEYTNVCADRDGSQEHRRCRVEVWHSCPKFGVEVGCSASPLANAMKINDLQRRPSAPTLGPPLAPSRNESARHPDRAAPDSEET